MENELTIEIPNGKTVDWEESKKQNRIVLKDKQLTYKEICDKLQGAINIPLPGAPLGYDNILVDEYQLMCILAKNKLANVAKYLNNGWKPTQTGVVYYLTKTLNNSSIFIGSCSIQCEYYFGKIVFKTEELAQQAIEILGEETINLALKPLGI